jgi:prepilin-type N-terminal cleavage/methylation domain-containing protein
MKQRLRNESGVTLVELLIGIAILGLISAGLTNVFVSGLRASSDTGARTAGQGTIQTAVNRLEYELRCASGATVPSTPSSSVTLTLPSECIHGTGQYTWCVSGASLKRYSGASCSGTAQTFGSNVTTATPFTLINTSGYLPQLQIAFAVNSGGSSDAVSISDTITLRNAARN